MSKKICFGFREKISELTLTIKVKKFQNLRKWFTGDMLKRYIVSCRDVAELGDLVMGCW